ncbi:hypothetical protein D5S17_34515 [Pseudonocardiaceae bacterium YIM PH 21723]|nr:hypothetical protein D5S17_34515 [Pseudonocardiaceae bacterium YIM PH 21723]
MCRKGITYDTGIHQAGHSTHEPWDPERVRRDLLTIRDELGATAVRVVGSEPDRLNTAATIAVELGMELWFSLFTLEADQEEELRLLAECAEHAERLRVGGAGIVLTTGAELGLFLEGILPGTLEERLALLTEPDRLRAEIPHVPARINAFLARAVTVVRDRFGGPISYASIPFEGVDWTPFDIIGVDLYRTAQIADRFAEGVRSLVARGKPVAITEFGCATYAGAGADGARGGEIVDWDGLRPLGLRGAYRRDEREQVTVFTELMDIFEAEGVDIAFCNTYVSYFLPGELDLASYGLITAEGSRKLAFDTFAAR